VRLGNTSSIKIQSEVNGAREITNLRSEIPNFKKASRTRGARPQPKTQLLLIRKSSPSLHFVPDHQPAQV
jgi:hypothetical protein